MKHFTAPDQTRVHYHDGGSASPCVIFLHGWTTSSREWLPFAKDLATQTRVICWDARGHGQHDYPDHMDMSLPRMAQDLQALIQHLQLEQVVLVGHSMGALTAWEYIRQFGQQQLAGLVVIDQSPRLITDADWRHGVYSNFSAQRNQVFLQRLEENFAEGVLELIANGHNVRSRRNYQQNSVGFQHMRDYLRKCHASLLTRCWASITEQDYRPVLADIQRPTLLIYGDQSQFYSAQLQTYVHQQIPTSRLHVYPAADHSPHLWHKARFSNEVSQWLAAL